MVDSASYPEQNTDLEFIEVEPTMKRHYMHEFLADASIDWEDATYTWYKNRLQRFLEWLREREIKHPKKLRPKHIRRYFSHLKKSGASFSTRNGSHTAIGQFCVWLHKNKLTKIDVFRAAEIPRPRKPRKKPRTIPLWAIERLIGTVERTIAAGLYPNPAAVRDLAMMRLLISTGIRRDELINLSLDRLDLSASSAHIIGKARNERMVYFDRETAEAIQNWLIYRPPELKHNFVFVSVGVSIKEPGSKLRPMTVNDRLNFWKTQADLPETINVSPHRWRHTYATQFISNGGSAFVLADLLGHTDMEITKIYVTMTGPDLQRQSNQFRPRLNTEDGYDRLGDDDIFDEE